MYRFEVVMPGVIFRPIYRKEILSGLSYQRKVVRRMQIIERRKATIVVSERIDFGRYHEIERHDVDRLASGAGKLVNINGSDIQIESVTRDDKTGEATVYFLDGEIQVFDSCDVTSIESQGGNPA